MWTCPECGERIEDQFDSCWRCAGDRIAPHPFLEPKGEGEPGTPPATQPGAARLPPWPPKLVALGFADDDGPWSVGVTIFEHSQRDGRIKPGVPLITLITDPAHGATTKKKFSLRDGQDLQASLFCIGDGASVAVTIEKSGRILMFVNCPVSATVRTTSRIFPETLISVKISRQAPTQGE